MHSLVHMQKLFKILSFGTYKILPLNFLANIYYSIICKLFERNEVIMIM